MTVPQASKSLESLEFVEEADAAPTDIGNIPCFQIELTHGAYMTDESMDEVEDVVIKEMSDSFSDDIVVQTSGEVIDGDFYIWAMVYEPYESFTQSGIEYNVVYHNDELLYAVPTDFTNPSNIDRFTWDEVPIDEIDY